MPGVLAACSPIDIPTPLTVETIVATASPEQAPTVSPSPTMPREATPAERLVLIDQASEFDATVGGWWSIHTLSPIGQTFTPSFAGLDAVELWTADQWQAECAGHSPEMQVYIREAGIDGPIVGSSLSVSLPSCYQGVTHFPFPALVPLTPGKPYLIEVVQASTANWGVVWQQLPDPYGAGETIVRGQPGQGDLWFRTGLAKSTPLTQAYCVDTLWQRLGRAEGTTFNSQSACLQYVATKK